MAEFCVHEQHGGICEKTGTYCNLGACPYEDLKEFAHVVHKRGEWEPYGMNPNGVVGNWHCSLCNGTSLKDSNFCPNCGADMRKVDHE